MFISILGEGITNLPREMNPEKIALKKIESEEG